MAKNGRRQGERQNRINSFSFHSNSVITVSHVRAPHPGSRHSQEFQSTPPTRAATVLKYKGKIDAYVSIHAAHAGGDTLVSVIRELSVCFNPRRPRGRRPGWNWSDLIAYWFQSTPPTRAAT